MTIILAAVAWLLTYLLHSTVLLAGAALLVAVGIVRSQAARDTLWKVALVGGLLTATTQVALRLEPAAGHVALGAQDESGFLEVAGVRDVQLPAPATAVIEQPAAAAFAAVIAGEPATDVQQMRQVRSLVSGLHISWPAMILQLWLFGALAFGIRLLLARVELMRTLRHRREIEDGPLADMMMDLAADADVPLPRLTASHTLSGPIAFGREICIPERVITDLTPGEQRAVLAHELGHVVRRDPAWLLVALAIESVFFFQPFNRFARRGMRAASEYLCDDWAAERTGGIVLARCLAEVAGWVQARPAPAVVAGMAGHCSHLVNRVERLLDGASESRPARWLVRASTAALALAVVAWSVPGVAAEDVGGNVSTDEYAYDDHESKSHDHDAAVSFASGEGEDGWGRIRDGGHLLMLAPGYSVRLTGRGRVGIRQWGRAIEVTSGYYFIIDGRIVDDNVDLCGETVVRIVETEGDGAWDIMPVRLDAPAQTGYGMAALDARPSSEAERAAREVARAGSELGASVGRLTALSLRSLNTRRLERDAATDAAIGGEADAAIDTLLQLWLRDPETVRRAARRIARTYDRDLRPQFESLGVEVGRELAPQLQRLTDRVGRDLTPEFARLGAELGLSIVAALGESPESGAGAGDYRGKGRKER